MKKMSFVLSSFLTIALLSGCAADSAQVQTPPTADPMVKSDLNTFNGWNAGFQLEYPVDFEVNSIQDPQSKVVLTLVYPGYYKQGTNLNEAKIIVTESREKDDVAKCTTGESTGKALTATKTVHSQVWYQEAWSDGAAGHTGDNVQYSTVFYGATCFKIAFQGYATNLALLNEDSQKAVAYDKAKLLNIFNTIVESFTFSRDA